MKPLIDAVVVTVTQNMARAIDLYRLGGIIGLMLGVTASILASQTRRSEAAHLEQTDLKSVRSETLIASFSQIARPQHWFLPPFNGAKATSTHAPPALSNL